MNEIDEIFKLLPFNSYSDLFNAIQDKKTTIKLIRSDCIKISSITHPYISTIGIYIGFLITVILLIFSSIKLSNYWLLLTIPFNFLLTFFICYISKLNYFAYIFVLIDLFILKLPNWSLIFAINIILISFFYNLWWNFCYTNAINILKCNQEAFLWSWNRNGLSIVDVYGNIYYKSKNREETLDTPQSITNDINRVNNIISGIEKIDKNLFIGLKNPYTGQVILNYADIIEYLKMYKLDYEEKNPLDIK